MKYITYEGANNKVGVYIENFLKSKGISAVFIENPIDFKNTGMMGYNISLAMSVNKLTRLRIKMGRVIYGRNLFKVNFIPGSYFHLRPDMA